jgi:hypothetical protein
MELVSWLDTEALIIDRNCSQSYKRFVRFLGTHKKNILAFMACVLKFSVTSRYQTVLLLSFNMNH